MSERPEDVLPAREVINYLEEWSSWFRIRVLASQIKHRALLPSRRGVPLGFLSTDLRQVT